MEIDFWVERWKEGRIGFHEGRTNTFLERHVGRLGEARRVLVPLCGKTVDMAFLASRGHEIVGIEAVPAAVEAFFREHELTPEVHELGGGRRRWSAAKVTLFESDVFACTPEEIGRVDAFYDRAALVALPPDVRPRYVSHVLGLLAPKARGLVVTFEYPEDQMSPPPFSVGTAEVAALYAGASVTSIDEAPLTGGRFEEAGVAGTERCLFVEL